MKSTDLTLLEQMRITELEIENRKTLFSIGDDEVSALLNVKHAIEGAVDHIVNRFYDIQTNIPEIALLIGDADTLRRLRSAQRRYIIDLFSGYYDVEYVNNRLRIGMVHKRIGVNPKLYLMAIYTLKDLVLNSIHSFGLEPGELKKTLQAVERLLMFDISLVFDTYIRSLIAEIESAKEKSEQYAYSLEQKVNERTRALETLSRTDPLTGLLNVRHLDEILTSTLRSARRRKEPVSLVYLDLDDFKKINDTLGHQHGDDVLRMVSRAISLVSRPEDQCFRYGGDEFCVVMPNCTELDARKQYAQRLVNEIHQHEARLRISFGCAQTGPDEYVSAEELIRCADNYMYSDKQLSKTGEIRFPPETT